MTQEFGPSAGRRKGKMRNDRRAGFSLYVFVLKAQILLLCRKGDGMNHGQQETNTKRCWMGYLYPNNNTRVRRWGGMGPQAVVWWNKSFSTLHCFV